MENKHRLPWEALDQACRAYYVEMSGGWPTSHEAALEVAMAALDRWFEMMDEQRRPDAAERNAQLVQAEINKPQDDIIAAAIRSRDRQDQAERAERRRKEVEQKIEDGGGF